MGTGFHLRLRRIRGHGVGAVACLAAVIPAVLAYPVLAPSANAGDVKLISELAPYKGPTRSDIGARTIKGLVLCGYQGWFRAVGDGVENHWLHWSSDPDKVTPDTLLVEMWPDMTDYPKSERFRVEGMKHADGRQAYLFSSLRPAVVDLHFKWMRDYGIDGVFVSRFIVGCGNPNSLSTTGVLAYSRNAANRCGRTFAVSYDMTGMPADRLYDTLVADWKFLVDKMKLTRDKRYLHENGKPVLLIYGFLPDRFSPGVANKIIDFFKNDPKYGTFLVGSGAWWWRSIEDPGWAKVYRRLDAFVPWNTGNCMQRQEGGPKMASTDYWAEDMQEARKHGMLYIPVVYPGFSWDNLMRQYSQPENMGHPIPRRGGQFLWEQFVTATKLKVDAIFVAMFDEVDEGTAIFKVTSDPPAGAHFVTFEGKPADWYLRLTGCGTRMFRGKVPFQGSIPANP